MNDEIRELLIRSETEIYNAYQRGDLDAIASVLADDFREIGSSYLNQFTPIRNCTVLMPGLGTVSPALEMCS